MPQARVALGLVHYPVYDKPGNIIATNVTNLDVHDIARAAQSFGIQNYYIINPMREQLMFVERLCDFWRVGGGRKYNPMRRTALSPVKTAETIEAALVDFDPKAKVVVTSAKEKGLPLVSFRDLRQQIQTENESFLLLFGTGFGLSDEVLNQADLVLEPIKGAPPQDYRHLSVRSAVSICLDRLLGSW